MLRIIEVYNSIPHQFAVRSTGMFYPGDIAQFYVEDGRTVVGVSDGLVPFGIIDDIRTAEDNSTGKTGKVSIWQTRGLFATTRFNPGETYPVNAVLFVGPDGKLTTRSQGPAYPAVGFVMSPPTIDNGTLQLVWE